MNLFDILAFLLSPHHDEDWVDMLNNKISAFVFTVTGLSIFSSEYLKEPLKCWSAAQWHGSWDSYAAEICFIDGGLVIPVNEKIPPSVEEIQSHKKMNFYQVRFH